MLEELHDYFYDEDGNMKSYQTSLLSCSERFCLTITIYLQYDGDINVQHAIQRQTLLSLLGDITLVAGNEINDEPTCKSSPFIVCNLSTLLLRHGADIDKGYDIKDGWKAIHYACLTGNILLVQLLLEHHCCTNHNTSINQMIQTECTDEVHGQDTAFHVISRFTDAFIPIVKLLLQYGTDINSHGKNGKTIFHEVRYSTMICIFHFYWMIVT
jgi:ankyrin repeat protein